LDEQDFSVFGFARSAMTHEEFRELIAGSLTCRIDRKCAR
jgi:glucose-6-phosphate 1-dehydrogenase